MAVDLEKIRAKVNQLNGIKNQGTVKVWKGTKKIGENTIRILPWKDVQEGMPFKERLVYFNIGKSWITSPQSFGKVDPIQEFSRKLWDSGKEEDKALAKKLFPKLMTCAAIIDRGAEDEGPQLWVMNKKEAADVLGLFLDAEYGDVTDLLEGTDLKVNVVPSGRMWAGKPQNDIKITPSRRASPASADLAKVTKWMENLPSVDEYFRQKSAEEIKVQFEEWLTSGGPQAMLNPDAETPGTEKGPETPDPIDALAKEVNSVKEEKPAKKSAKAKSGNKEFSSVDEALDNALNDLEDLA